MQPHLRIQYIIDSAKTRWARKSMWLSKWLNGSAMAYPAGFRMWPGSRLTQRLIHNFVRFTMRCIEQEDGVKETIDNQFRIKPDPDTNDITKVVVDFLGLGESLEIVDDDDIDSIYYSRIGNEKAKVKYDYKKDYKKKFESNLRSQMAIADGYLKTTYLGDGVNSVDSRTILLTPYSGFKLFPDEE